VQNDKAIQLGHPSYVWRFGQDRRLEMIRAYVNLETARMLDIGCGIGAYVEKFRAFESRAFGVDLDADKLQRARADKHLTTLAAALSEHLPFPDNTFDAVLLHEVIEHVADDRATIQEARRVTRAGGHILVFAPNRLYPFETHGAYFSGKYRFGNIPLIGYLPDPVRARLAPHVRAYTPRGIKKLFDGLAGSFLIHTQIYPGYDKIAARHPRLARIFRALTYALESSPLRVFGLSHFVVWRKGRS
jgi:SAM-dependent methyltransferase